LLTALGPGGPFPCALALLNNWWGIPRLSTFDLHRAQNGNRRRSRFPWPFYATARPSGTILVGLNSADPLMRSSRPPISVAWWPREKNRRSRRHESSPVPLVLFRRAGQWVAKRPGPRVQLSSYASLLLSYASGFRGTSKPSVRRQPGRCHRPSTGYSWCRVVFPCCTGPGISLTVRASLSGRRFWVSRSLDTGTRFHALFQLNRLGRGNERVPSGRLLVPAPQCRAIALARGLSRRKAERSNSSEWAVAPF